LKLNINNYLKQFAGLSPRERFLSVLATVLVLFYGLYLFVVDPILADNIVLEQKIKAQQQAYQYLNNISTEVERLRNQQPKMDNDGQGQSLMAIIDASSAEKDMKSCIKRMIPDEVDTVTLWLENCSFDRFIEWIAVLEGERGIGVNQISVEAEQVNKDKVSIKVMLSH
jgi:type II secretory pathway component PulM